MSEQEYPGSERSEEAAAGTAWLEPQPRKQPEIEADLNGKVAVVTGGGWNIGRAVSLKIAEAGAKVVICSRNRVNLEETVGMARERGWKMRAIPCDLTKPREVEACFADVAATEGPADILVCLAGGFGAGQPIHETDPEEWLDVLLRNFYATYLCCRAVLPAMLDRKRGDILTCAGGGAFFPMVGVHATAYASAKAAVCRFTDQLYAELIEVPGIRVNCLEPGLTWSPKDLERIEEEERRTGQPHPLRERNHDPEDGAELALFLLSPAAAALNGRILSVDEDWWKDPERVAYVARTDLYRLRRTFEEE